MLLQLVPALVTGQRCVGIVLIRRGIFASQGWESSWKTASLLDLEG